MDHPATHPFPYFGILATRDAAAIKAAVEKMYALKKPLQNHPLRTKEYREFFTNAALMTRMVFGAVGKFEPDMEKVEALLAKCLPELETFALKQVEADGKTLLPAKLDLCVEHGEKSLGLSHGLAQFHLEKFLKARGIGVGARGSVRDDPQVRHTAHPFPYLGIAATHDLSAISKALEAKFREVAPFENDSARQDEFLLYMRNATVIAKHRPEVAGRFKPDADRVDAVLRRAMLPIETFVMEQVEDDAIHPKELERCIEAGRKQFGVAASVSRPHLEEFLERKRIAVTSRAGSGDGPRPVLGVPLEDEEESLDDIESRASARRSVIKRSVEEKKPLPKWIFAAIAGVVLLSAGGGAVLYAVFFNKKKPEVAEVKKEEPEPVKPIERPPPAPSPAPVAPPDSKSKDAAAKGTATTPKGSDKPDVKPKPAVRGPFPTPNFRAGATWATYKSPDGGFAAHFPGTPGRVPAPSFDRINLAVALDSANEVVHVSVLSGPLDPRMPNEIRQSMLADLLGPPQFGKGPMMGPGGPPGMKGPMPGPGGMPGMMAPQKISEKDVKWLGQDAKEVVLEWPMSPTVKNTVVGRGFIKGDRLVVARIAGAGGRPPPEYEKEFFEKFELLK